MAQPVQANPTIDTDLHPFHFQWEKDKTYEYKWDLLFNEDLIVIITLKGYHMIQFRPDQQLLQVHLNKIEELFTSIDGYELKEGLFQVYYSFAVEERPGLIPSDVPLASERVRTIAKELIYLATKRTMQLGMENIYIQMLCREPFPEAKHVGKPKVPWTIRGQDREESYPIVIESGVRYVMIRWPGSPEGDFGMFHYNWPLFPWKVDKGESYNYSTGRYFP